MSKKTDVQGVVVALLVSNLVSAVLFGMRVVATQDTQYWFLFWNLLLAWLPVMWAWLLMKTLKTQRWQEPQAVAYTLLWLAFLPNSFYIMSDLIHLTATGDIGLLFDTVLFLSCIFNGVVAGMLSVYWVHKALIQRRGSRMAARLIAGVFLLSSLAIYLGRNLRWNTWDILVNPLGLLFDVSERVVNPLAHPQVFLTTTTFFALLSSMYFVVWKFTRLIQHD
jgi:uncharacterized membrane protein